MIVSSAPVHSKGEFSMLYLIGRYARRPFVVIQRRFLARTLPLMLVISLVTPLTVSCQRKPSDPNRGIAELSALVDSTQGRPAPAELQRIESAYPRTRAAA